MERRSVALTFDVDLVDWVSGQNVDELSDVMPALLRVLAEIGDVHATFFVRLDDGIARRFGRADHAFVQAVGLWDRVRGAGHEVAWHHHAATNCATPANGLNGEPERPEQDAERLLDGVTRHSLAARALGCTSTRMGWGQHTQETLAQLALDGWRADSSAMPRPVYAWDPPLRDWSRAPSVPYLIDELALGHSRARALWEVPITMVPMATATDTRSDVCRYVNPAYRAHVFAAAIAVAPTDDPLVLLCHPYECAGGRQHPLYAFSMDAVRANLTRLANHGARWLTINELVNEVESRPQREIDADAA